MGVKPLQSKNDPMLEVFIFETASQIEQLEQAVIEMEAQNECSQDNINQIFRVMHTIKSSAAMMLFNNISKLAHSTEDLFYYIRESKPQNLDISSLCDIVFEAIDFIKLELEKIKNEDLADGNEQELIIKIGQQLEQLKRLNGDGVPIKTEKASTEQFYISPNKANQNFNTNVFKAVIFFQQGCEMENIRAFSIVHNLKEITEEFQHIPKDIINDNDSSEIIKKEGFIIYLKTDKSYNFMEEFFSQTIFLDKLTLTQLENDQEYNMEKPSVDQSNDVIIPQIHEEVSAVKQAQSNAAANNIISVNVDKLDKLMDLVGEMVIAEEMVIQNPDLIGLSLNNFEKAARQLKKITAELQDIVMSVRMVPLGPTFFKMNRIVRDMSKKLDKQVNLSIIGEETEVDKNIIEHIGDPIMHIVRNALDHGIENAQERLAKGKPKAGTITLEAKNAGSEVLILIKDDGKGLSKDNILKKALTNNLIHKNPEEMTDREIYNLIFLPGFSTKEAVTEFSGRGVGMDVVIKNIEAVGGSVQVESVEGKGTTMILKIPLTLAIIEGMNIQVGRSRFTIPITSIKESFRPKKDEIIKDPDGNEMIMIRGQCYPILRVHQYYSIQTEVTDMSEGIIIVIDSEDKTICVFADKLVGKQQVVVKALPNYIRNIKKIKGISGCTLLGGGGISLILDPNELLNQS
jgi:two-component system chemotaxis sensor kinase CheA